MAEVNDLYAVKLYTKLGDQLGLVVRHYLVTAKGGTGASDQQIADTAATNMNTSFRACVSAEAAYAGLGVQRIQPLPLTQEVISYVGVGACTAAGEALPRQTCGIITLRTLFAGRRYRGRAYVPFPTESQNSTGGIPTAAYVTLLTTFGLDLLLQINTAGANNNDMIPVVYSRKFNLKTGMTTIQARNKWGTQRRRGSYGRPNA